MSTHATTSRISVSDLYAAAGTTLADLERRVAIRSSEFEERRLSPEEIELGPEGRLHFGGESLDLAPVAWRALASYAGLPAATIQSLDNPERAFVLNRRKTGGGEESRLPPELRLMVNGREGVVAGISDAALVQACTADLVGVIAGSLPDELSPEGVRVEAFHDDGATDSLKLYSPSTRVEPRKGDAVNGGVAIAHSTVGAHATQIHSYMRRLACRNGMISHVCVDGRNTRTRRVLEGEHQLEKLLAQFGGSCRKAWEQLDDKLGALTALLEKKGDPEKLLAEFVQAYRRKLSLNDRTVNALREALARDEMPATATAWDLMNALSRVATHGTKSLMTPRQRQTLLRAAGELAHQSIKRCQQCGTWLEGATQ